jgi:hypothetical protein
LLAPLGRGQVRTVPEEAVPEEACQHEANLAASADGPVSLGVLDEAPGRCHIHHRHRFGKRPKGDGEEVPFLFPGSPPGPFNEVQQDTEGSPFKLVTGVPGGPGEPLKLGAEEIEAASLTPGLEAFMGEQVGGGCWGEKCRGDASLKAATTTA